MTPRDDSSPLGDSAESPPQADTAAGWDGCLAGIALAFMVASVLLPMNWNNMTSTPLGTVFIYAFFAFCCFGVWCYFTGRISGED
jgi:hypothetical protein